MAKHKRKRGGQRRDRENLGPSLAHSVMSAADAWREYEKDFKNARSLLDTHDGRRQLLRKFAGKRTELELSLYECGIRNPRDIEGILDETNRLESRRKAIALFFLGPYLAYDQSIRLLTQNIRPPKVSESSTWEKMQEQLETVRKMPCPTEDQLHEFAMSLPLEEAFDYISGRWFQEWFGHLMEADHEGLRSLATALVSGYIYKNAQLLLRIRRRLEREGGNPRKVLAEMLPGAVVEARRKVPAGEALFGGKKFLNKAIELAAEDGSPKTKDGLPKERLKADLLPDYPELKVDPLVTEDYTLKLEAEDDKQLIRRALEGFQGLERECQELDLKGLTRSEIASCLGITKKQVRVHLHRALEKLRRAFSS